MGATSTVEHLLNCKIGGFVSIRHNELRDLTGYLLAEVCHDVKIKPQLTPLTGERLSHKSSNKMMMHVWMCLQEDSDKEETRRF